MKDTGRRLLQESGHQVLVGLTINPEKIWMLNLFPLYTVEHVVHLFTASKTNLWVRVNLFI